MRSDDGVSLQRVVSLLDGGTISFLATLDREEGTVTRELMRTTADGEVYTTDNTLDRADDGGVIV